MAYNALNNLIDAYIYANGVQAITGQILNGVLKQMVSQLGSGYHLMGVADPETVPASNDYAMAYFAATAGEYTDFGGITLAAGEVAVLLTYGNGSWSKQTIYNVPTGTADLENTANFITNAVTDLVNYYTKTEVDDTLANYPTLEALATALADYYTKTEIDTILAGYTTNTALASALADYYNKNDIDGLLSVVNAALADRYTKSETDTKLADYYRKAETYDKDEVDSIVAALSRQEYIVAWDGLAAPDVSAIPAGVTVTYSGTTYTGTLAASASTVNKIYMVWNGTAYDMYGTSQDGGYSWVPMGTTTVDLSQYATKAELSQLEAKVNYIIDPGTTYNTLDPSYNRVCVFYPIPDVNATYHLKVTDMVYAEGGGISIALRSAATPYSGSLLAAIPNDTDYTIPDSYKATAKYIAVNSTLAGDAASFKSELYVASELQKKFASIDADLFEVKPIFVEGVGGIKELYFNSNATGVELKLHSFHNGYGSKWRVQFCNNAGNAFTAKTLGYDSKQDATGIIPIYRSSNNTLIGYIIVDWDKFPQLETVYNPAKAMSDICYNVGYSPAIKEYIDKAGTDSTISTIQEQITDISGTVSENTKDIDYMFPMLYLGDRKDFSLLLANASLTDYVYWQYPKKRISHINRIRFKAKTGTVYFYVVTYNTGETTATATQIASVTNTSAENGSTKEIAVDVTLAENQFIGINGDFNFGNDAAAQDYTGGYFTVQTGNVNSSNAGIALAFEALNMDSIPGKLESAEEIDTTPLGHSVGAIINRNENIFILDENGNGDYTTFAAAHSACASAASNGGATMVIMPGIYTIDPMQVGGNGYSINYDIVGIGDVLLKCIYTGDTTSIRTGFSPFNFPSPETHKTTRIEGISLVCSGVRYCVHDEMGSLNAPSYTHIFKNCKFVHLSEPDGVWASPRCIGGGLGNQGLVIIDGCEFESKIDTSVDYHSGYDGGAESSKVIVKESTFANNTLSCTTTTIQSDKSVMIVQNCVLKSAPICNDRNGRIDVELVCEGNIII